MDPSMSLQRWQQAFEDHPISTTRVLEKQLRSSIANNRERLRGLVGGNYRELLSTADRIVYLDGRTKAIELRLSELGRQCVPPSQAVKPSISKGSQLIPELSLLHKCLEAARQVLKTADLLRAAQFVVIARLLQNSLQSSGTPPSSLEAFQSITSSLRRQCISQINSSLANPRSSTISVVQAACAYCLITSVSASEAFQYTLRLRLERLKVVVTSDSPSTDSSCKILRYILGTINILRRAFGRPLSDALSNLQRRPVLQDLDVVTSGVVASQESLLLISEDVRSFSPYFKREPIASTESSSRLISWTADACTVLKETLHKDAGGSDKSSEVLDLRRKLLSILLPSYFSSNAGQLILETVSASISERLIELAEQRASGLKVIAAQLAERSLPNTQNLDLWNHELAVMSFNDGCDAFLGQVHRRFRGQTSFLSSMSKRLKRWIETTRAALADLEEVRSVRWRDLLEEPSDEQEDDAIEIIKTLSDGQLQQLADKMKHLTRDSIAAAETIIVESVNTVLNESEDTNRAVYQVRAIRIFLGPLQHALPDDATLTTLGATVDALHKMIAKFVVSKTLEAHKASAPTQEEKSVIEGLPSPAAYSLLQGVCEAMYNVGGTDVWSRAAVIRVKQVMKDEIFPANGKKDESWNDFDQAYLACALDQDISATPDTAVANGAKDYWHRTRLLFGILAGQSS